MINSWFFYFEKKIKKIQAATSLNCTWFRSLSSSVIMISEKHVGNTANFPKNKQENSVWIAIWQVLKFLAEHWALQIIYCFILFCKFENSKEWISFHLHFSAHEFVFSSWVQKIWKIAKSQILYYSWHGILGSNLVWVFYGFSFFQLLISLF